MGELEGIQEGHNVLPKLRRKRRLKILRINVPDGSVSNHIESLTTGPCAPGTAAVIDGGLCHLHCALTASLPLVDPAEPALKLSFPWI